MRRGASAAIALCALAFGGVANAQAPQSDYRWALPDWRQTWSGGPLADDRGFAVDAVEDGVYVAGVSGSGPGGGDLLLQRYSHEGQLLWSREWGGLELDQAQDLAVASDGSIWVIGSEASTADGVPRAALLKFDPDAGDHELVRIWNRGVTTSLQAITAADDALYVAGLSHPSTNDRDAYVARLALDGSTTWQRTWGGDKWDEAWDLVAGEGVLYVPGYTTEDNALETTENLLLLVDSETGALERAVTWGSPGGNDEARAAALEGDTLWLTGGGVRGTSGDAYLAKVGLDGTVIWTKYAGGRMTGGYGIAVGDRGIYVAGGSYDFPAGGDMAISRWSREGEVEWSQIYGYPGLWEWGFDVDTHDGRFFLTGTLFTPGSGWYEVFTLAYDEDFEEVSLQQTVEAAAAGDATASSALDHYWLGDMLRWAQGAEAQEQRDGGGSDHAAAWRSESAAEDPAPETSEHGAARLYWTGASDFGRERGDIWVDPGRDPAVGEDNAVEAITGLQRDSEGNRALVRDYTGFRGSAANGLIRFRYFISHDRLIPQGGFISVGDTTVPLPPPPV